MPRLMVDQKALEGTLAAMFGSISGVRLLYPFDPEPDEQGESEHAVVTWHGLNVSHKSGGRREGDKHTVSFELLITVEAPHKATKADGWELSSACTKVADAFMGYREQTTTPDHTISGIGWERIDDPGAGDGAARTARVQVTGECTRRSGTTFL